MNDHLYCKDIHELISREKTIWMLVKDHLPRIKCQILESCTHYLFVINIEIGFQISDKTSRRNYVFEFVHSNIYGSSKKFIGRVYYFVTFIILITQLFEWQKLNTISI
ncbi:hypothetical protein Lal_00010073 [Lupinus albus]|nr:hypothetical protein Lal_00010073 [Lupinus albus]